MQITFSSNCQRVQKSATSLADREILSKLRVSDNHAEYALFFCFEATAKSSVGRELKVDGIYKKIAE
jgi:hypothetical protein